MNDSHRKLSNGEQVGSERQYVQIRPPSTPEMHTWNSQIPQNSFLPHFDLPHGEQLNYPLLDNQLPPIYTQQSLPFTYVQQPGLCNSFDQNNPDYVYRQSLLSKPRVDDFGLYQHEYRPFTPQNFEDVTLSDHIYGHEYQENPIPNRTHLIENLVGNWTPNTSGTYSPFGNPQTYVPNVMFNYTDREVLEDKSYNHDEDLHSFSFMRDSKKPRIVAEVKPMRPSYSDVLAKSAPQTKIPKVDPVKQKKENNKQTSNKTHKPSLSRSSLNNGIKDPFSEKYTNNVKSNEKKEPKINQLNRKWASLDNVNQMNDMKTDFTDIPKAKKMEELGNKNATKINSKKVGKSANEFEDVDSGSNKSDVINITKTSLKKGTKTGTKKNHDASTVAEKPPGKRNQRCRKRESHVPFGVVGQKLRQLIPRWWKMFIYVTFWLVHLISDICSLSVHLTHDMMTNFCAWFVIHWALFLETTIAILQRIRFVTWLFEKLKKKKPEAPHRTFLPTDLQHNITMPSTGDEAMKRLLACKGKDPYSILGVTPTCTDDDIKRYYKRQAVLVHPDKNQQPGAEEAFKILVHAFDMIGEPERRAGYDRGVAESAQVEQAWSELTELLAQLQQKVEAAANTIRCSACGSRHKRIKIERPYYAARNCTTCKIHHSAREGDIWAEAKCFGFLWHYYACMDGAIYDITEWAGCQKDNLKHLKPDSHHVQYRIALGKQNGQPKRHSSPRNERPPDLENLLSSLYGQHVGGAQNVKKRNKKAK